nr:MAG TPA: hypothetical protein [Caudoviricetes sp.]
MILSLIGIWTISKVKDNKQGRSRQCYIPIYKDGLYIVWRGLLFIT